MPSTSEDVHRPPLPRAVRVMGDVAWRVVAVAIALWVAWLVFQHLRVVILPVVFAVFLAAILRPVAAWLQRIGAPRLLATWVACFGALIVLAGAFTATGYVVYRQAGDLGQALSDGWDQILAWLRQSPLHLSQQQVRNTVDDIGSSLMSSSGSSGLFARAATVAEIVTQFLLTLFLTFFFVKDGRRLADGVIGMLAESRRRQAEELATRVWDTIGRYIRGVTAIATINAISKGIALYLIGIPLILPLMFLTFVGSFIPFAGPIIAALAGALVALANGSVVDAGLVILAGLVIQQVEGHILQPLILGRFMKLHPVVIILSVTTGAVVAGLFGAMVAVPAVAGATAAAGYLQEQGAGG